jgi:hypothetical protein
MVSDHPRFPGQRSCGLQHFATVGTENGFIVATVRGRGNRQDRLASGFTGSFCGNTCLPVAASDPSVREECWKPASSPSVNTRNPISGPSRVFGLSSSSRDELWGAAAEVRSLQRGVLHRYRRGWRAIGSSCRRWPARGRGLLRRGRKRC